MQKVVLITGARAPSALHLARLLNGAGIRVILADSFSSPIAASSTACAAYYQLPSPRFSFQKYGAALANVVAKESVELIIPTCEEIFYIAKLVEQSLLATPVLSPDIHQLSTAHNKFEFINECAQLGLNVPETTLLNNKTDLVIIANKSHKLVFKPVWSRFANDVLICPSAKKALKIIPSIEKPWVAQEFIQGEEISAYAFAIAGQIRGVFLYRSLYHAGRGAGICFEPINEPEAVKFIKYFVAGTGWTGQISFDFIKKPDGSIWPLECNPRATSGIHFCHNAKAFSNSLIGDGAMIGTDISNVQTTRLALWSFGLIETIRNRQLSKFVKTAKFAKELLSWPEDPKPQRAQFRAFVEILGISIMQRISLQAAATRDIEWNGPDHNSIE